LRDSILYLGAMSCIVSRGKCLVGVSLFGHTN
jgi:hypothetical protein